MRGGGTQAEGVREQLRLKGKEAQVLVSVAVHINESSVIPYEGTVYSKNEIVTPTGKYIIA